MSPAQEKKARGQFSTITDPFEHDAFAKWENLFFNARRSKKPKAVGANHIPNLLGKSRGLEKHGTERRGLEGLLQEEARRRAANSKTRLPSKHWTCSKKQRVDSSWTRCHGCVLRVSTFYSDMPASCPGDGALRGPLGGVSRSIESGGNSLRTQIRS